MSGCWRHLRPYPLLFYPPNDPLTLRHPPPPQSTHAPSLSPPPPLQVTFNTLIDVYGKTGSWEEAVRVLDTLEQQGIEPEIRTFNTVIIACNMSGQAQEALKIYERMLVRRRHTAPAVLCRAVLCVCAARDSAVHGLCRCASCAVLCYAVPFITLPLPCLFDSNKPHIL